MSLHLLSQTEPISYEACKIGDELSIYQPTYCNDPREFREELTSILGFWYNPIIDRYVIVGTLGQTAWPGWRINNWEIHPETGLETNVTRDMAGAVGLFWTRSWNAGDFNKVYALRIVPTREVAEIDPVTLVPKTTPVFKEDDLSPKPFMKNFVLNRADGLVLVDTTATLEVHDYTAAGTTLLGSLASPSLTLTDMSYEDNERAWTVALNVDGTTMVGKVNYKNFKYEALTRLQPGDLPDTDAAIAYDGKRKTVAIFRLRPPDTNGAAIHKLEIYKPFSVATNLTEPVPVTPVVKGEVATFSAHVYGDGGEVGQLKPVTVTNTGDGTILQSTVTPKSNGAITFQYLAGDNPGTDTIKIEADL
jgi:hypothetical protein